MKEVVVDVKLITLPVTTSVMVIRYSVMTPLVLLEGGGDHVRLMEVELIGESWTL